jgi:hypothetical protein
LSDLSSNLMAELVNLRQVRKRAARTKQAQHAQQSRVDHGRSKAERDLAHARNEKVQRALDGHRRDGGGQ